MLFGRKSENRSETAAEGAKGSAPEPAPGSQPAGHNPKTGSEARSGSGNGTRSQSFIDASLTIVGDLHSDGDVQLDGRVCGNATCAQLIVGRDAAITGSITAEQAIIRGTVTGTIRAGAVILQDTARVESEITYTVLAVDDGATFEGAAHHSDNPRAEAETSSSLADLQQLIRATGNGSASNGRPVEAHDAAALLPPAAPPGLAGT